MTPKKLNIGMKVVFHSKNTSGNHAMDGMVAEIRLQNNGAYGIRFDSGFAMWAHPEELFKEGGSHD